MPKTIQIRNVPDALHGHLRLRAAAAGISLSDYLLAEIKEIAERLQIFDRLQAHLDYGKRTWRREDLYDRKSR
jgi:plasmid stability protein